jgi:putative membrane protein
MAEEGGRLHIRTMPSNDQSTTKASLDVPLEKVRTPASPGVTVAPLPFTRRESLDIDDYFTGPRDIAKHSKWPNFLRMHGSIVPKMILPLFFIGAWATAVTVIYMKVTTAIGVNSVLLTILGFVVGLGLSFRSSTAYERYAEGRRYWGALILSSQCLARAFWIHARTPEGEDERKFLLKKISVLNLIVAFSVSLKHQLRFEPYSAYPDLMHLVGHLDTFAKEAAAADGALVGPRPKNFFKHVGEYLGVSFAESNPRKALKKATRPIGNLPLEIISHLAVTIDSFIRAGSLEIPMHQTLAYNNLNVLNDVMTGCERVLSTPLPIAYTIAISQITWVYLMALPLQLVIILDWKAIPATVVAAYIIMGLLLIGNEIENPFGQDVNDLPLESYCEQIATELDIISSFDKMEPESFLLSENGMPLYPVSTASANTWMARSEDKLREAIRSKPQVTFQWRKARDDGSTPNKSYVGDNAV